MKGRKIKIKLNNLDAIDEIETDGINITDSQVALIKAGKHSAIELSEQAQNDLFNDGLSFETVPINMVDQLSEAKLKASKAEYNRGLSDMAEMMTNRYCEDKEKVEGLKNALQR